MKIMKGKTQKELLLSHFDTANSISNVEAQAIYKIRALPRRISDLKEEGYSFEHEWRTDPTGQRYMRYYLVGRPTTE
tara:strand:+ start:292 stop:522 length:231 start_codon:yes stop_codon:yes gene_type:complete